MDTVKKLVSRRLNSQVPDSHPEPELLAALAENSIPNRERDNVFNHLSACADCRDILYLALPETALSQQAFALPRKQSRFAFRWATLVASVIIIGSVVISNRGIFTEHPAKAPEIGASSQPQASAAKTRAIVQEPAEASAKGTLARLRPPAKHMTATPQAAMQFDQSGQVHFAAAAPAAKPMQLPSRLDQLKASRQVNSIQAFSTAAPNPVWRISADGVPQRSFDGAQSWQAVSVRQGGPFRVIASVGHDVWIGGNAGSLYHSMDFGQNWTKVEPTSNGETLTADITKITFSDSQNGDITTSNGEVWSTSDGGKNWQL